MVPHELTLFPLMVELHMIGVNPKQHNTPFRDSYHSFSSVQCFLYHQLQLLPEEGSNKGVYWQVLLV